MCTDVPTSIPGFRNQSPEDVRRNPMSLPPHVHGANAPELLLPVDRQFIPGGIKLRSTALAQRSVTMPQSFRVTLVKQIASPNFNVQRLAVSELRRPDFGSFERPLPCPDSSQERHLVVDNPSARKIAAHRGCFLGLPV